MLKCVYDFKSETFGEWRGNRLLRFVYYDWACDFEICVDISQHVNGLKKPR
jgi:hypothetical protein